MPKNAALKIRKGEKNALSVQIIVETGLIIADQSTVDDVSIRKIAEELAVTPMAIYRHFSDKESLLSAMLDEFIHRADVIPRKKLVWQKWIKQMGMAMYKVLCESPSWIPLFGRLNMKPGALAVMESFMRTMTTAGFSNEQAARAFFGLLQNLIGAATLHRAFASQDAQNIEMESLDAGQYPHVAHGLMGIANAMSGDFMSNGLDLLIEGLQMELAANK